MRRMKRLLSRQTLLYALVFVGAAALTAAVAALLVNIDENKDAAASYPLKVVEISDTELDPEVWGKNFPLEYDRFVKTEEDYGRTPYGGSEDYSKIERYPAMVRLWAGYAFSKDHDEDRGHFYMQTDQATTERVKLVDQPGACINCHSANMPALVEELGWEEFNHTPYNELKDQLVYGSSCADCHDPDTMELRVTRPAFINAMEARGVDLSEATRQEMRTYVCAQCHVEYYFKGDNKVLTFPWSKGFTIDNIEEHYDEYEFKDWTHAETGASMIKIQHPEFEMWSTGIHAESGVSCADCHMPYIREGSVKISDHWLRSPLQDVESACGTCHNVPADELYDRVVNIQDKTASLLRLSEDALLSAIDTIVEAKALGLTDEELKEALDLHRSAQLRWDYVSSENSTGFHSPQEAARVLANCIDLARQSELAARAAMAEKAE
ncbi:MAG: ammonia-forming cytochrome c nitrite reductase subunit c552 [Chloroflexi bacterium]|nr:ammonia-forming cytochrome c nitrite reductase subunit c552 [Chloroflexota bacterium]